MFNKHDQAQREDTVLFEQCVSQQQKEKISDDKGGENRMTLSIAKIHSLYI